MYEMKMMPSYVTKNLTIKRPTIAQIVECRFDESSLKLPPRHEWEESIADSKCEVIWYKREDNESVDMSVIADQGIGLYKQLRMDVRNNVEAYYRMLNAKYYESFGQFNEFPPEKIEAIRDDSHFRILRLGLCYSVLDWHGLQGPHVEYDCLWQFQQYGDEVYPNVIGIVKSSNNKFYLY